MVKKKMVKYINRNNQSQKCVKCAICHMGRPKWDPDGVKEGSINKKTKKIIISPDIGLLFLSPFTCCLVIWITDKCKFHFPTLRWRATVFTTADWLQGNLQSVKVTAIFFNVFLPGSQTPLRESAHVAQALSIHCLAKRLHAGEIRVTVPLSR